MRDLDTARRQPGHHQGGDRARPVAGHVDHRRRRRDRGAAARRCASRAATRCRASCSRRRSQPPQVMDIAAKPKPRPELRAVELTTYAAARRLSSCVKKLDDSDRSARGPAARRSRALRQRSICVQRRHRPRTCVMRAVQPSVLSNGNAIAAIDFVHVGRPWSRCLVTPWIRVSIGAEFRQTSNAACNEFEQVAASRTMPNVAWFHHSNVRFAGLRERDAVPGGSVRINNITPIRALLSSLEYENYRARAHVAAHGYQRRPRSQEQ